MTPNNPHSHEYSRFMGDDVEKAYAEILQGEIIGGIDDKGKDLRIDADDIPYIQIKSSWEGAMDFLSKGLKLISSDTGGRYRYIPICVGEPGTKEEILQSIRDYGGWIGKDIPNREENLLKLKKARDYILVAQRGK